MGQQLQARGAIDELEEGASVRLRGSGAGCLQSGEKRPALERRGVRARNNVSAPHGERAESGDAVGAVASGLGLGPMKKLGNVTTMTLAQRTKAALATKATACFALAQLAARLASSALVSSPAKAKAAQSA